MFKKLFLLAKKIFSFKIKAKIQLRKTPNGLYIIYAYGQYLTNTLTESLEEAEDTYYHLIESKKEKVKEDIILKEDNL